MSFNSTVYVYALMNADFKTYLLAGHIGQPALTMITSTLANGFFITTHLQRLLNSLDLHERRSLVDEYRRIELMNRRGIANASDNDAALAMIQTGVDSIYLAGRLNEAAELLAEIAPPGLQTLDDWYARFPSPQPLVDPGRAHFLVDDYNTEVTNMFASHQPDPDAFAFTSRAQPEMTSNVNQSFPVLDPQLQNTGSFFYPVDSTSEATGMARRRTKPVRASSTSTSATTAWLSSVSRSPTARTAVREKVKTKHQRERARNKRGIVKSTKPKRLEKKKEKKGTNKDIKNASTTKTKARTRKPGSDAWAPLGTRFLCPYHTSSSNTGSKCLKIRQKKGDMMSHVRNDHQGGVSGWGTNASDWAACGPFNFAYLRSLGVARLPLYDEDENELDEEEKGGSEDGHDDDDDAFLSDGSSHPDDNDGGPGDGYALVRVVAVV